MRQISGGNFVSIPWLQDASVQNMLSCVKSHYTNQGIRANKMVSVSLVDEAFLPKADYTGCVSGSKEDKSRLFDYEMGEAGTLVPKDVPLSMECEVDDIYETKGFDNFILKIRNTYAREEILGDNGKISYEKLKPALFSMKLVKANGGQSIAVFKKRKKSIAKQLLGEGRVDFIVEADYRENSELDDIVKLILDKMTVADQLVTMHRKHEQSL